MSNPITNPMFVLLSKHNPAMFHTLSRHFYKVSIMCTENKAQVCSPFQVINVTFAKSF